VQQFRRVATSARRWDVVCCVALGIVGCGFASGPKPGWRLVWKGQDARRYFVDTTTIRAAGDSVSAIAWDLQPLKSVGLRVGLRVHTPSIERTREALVIDCRTRTVDGSGVTSIQRISGTEDRGVTIFGGTADDSGPHAALARSLCQHR
jgi:hypothetical protein